MRNKDKSNVFLINIRYLIISNEYDYLKIYNIHRYDYCLNIICLGHSNTHILLKLS